MKENIITARITAEERETHFYIIGDTATCDSTIARDFNRCLRQGWKILEKTSYEDGTVAGMVLEAPRKSLSIRNADPAKRVYTDEQRQAMADRLKIARESK